MLAQALRIASQITHPFAVAAFALVFVGIAFIQLRTRMPRIRIFLGAVILLLGIAPLVASTILQLQGIYRVRVLVLGPDNSPIGDVHVTCSTGAEPKKTDGGWEFDIPPQTRPVDREVWFFASVRSAFLTGRSNILLADDYYPTLMIQLTADTSASLRGSVLDENGRPVAHATVSIVGYPDVIVTDNTGNFVLPAHAADGQIVQVRAQKDRLAGTISAPAGRVPVEVTIKQP